MKRSIPNHSGASFRPCKGVEIPSRREGKRGQPGVLGRKTRSPIFLLPSVPQSSGRWSLGSNPSFPPPWCNCLGCAVVFTHMKGKLWHYYLLGLPWGVSKTIYKLLLRTCLAPTVSTIEKLLCYYYYCYGFQNRSYFSSPPKVCSFPKGIWKNLEDGAQEILGWPKSLLWVFCKMLWKTLNELFGQPNMQQYIHNKDFTTNAFSWYTIKPI